MGGYHSGEIAQLPFSLGYNELVALVFPDHKLQQKLDLVLLEQNQAILDRSLPKSSGVHNRQRNCHGPSRMSGLCLDFEPRGLGSLDTRLEVGGGAERVISQAIAVAPRRTVAGRNSGSLAAKCLCPNLGCPTAVNTSATAIVWLPVKMEDEIHSENVTPPDWDLSHVALSDC